jgi:hypothetical protein
LLPKENLIPMDCSTCYQIFKKLWRSETISFKGANRASQLSSRLNKNFQDLAYRQSLFETQYLPGSRKIEDTSHPGHSTIFVDHHGAILVRNGALVHLEYGFQLAYLTTILSNQFF